MANYLIKRAGQMAIVVIMVTIVIFLLLNAVPGGPLSGLNLSADHRSRFTEGELARMGATLGLNKPIVLVYLTWVLGESWVDEAGDALGNPSLNDKLVVTGTWTDYQSPTCQGAGGSNEGAASARSLPCSRGVLRGDFGTSWKLARGQAVTAVIGSRFANTIRLTATASLLSLVIAIPSWKCCTRITCGPPAPKECVSVS